MDFGQILAATLSPDQKTRESATNALEGACHNNFSAYINSLATTLADGNKDSNVRQAAGVALKNALTGKSVERQEEYSVRWMDLPSNLRDSIKQTLLSSLSSPNPRVGTSVAQGISAIAQIELPLGEWKSLMSHLMATMSSGDSSESLKRSTLETIGFICEFISPNVLESVSHSILTAVVNGLRFQESMPVRAAAANAMLNSLDFAKDIMSHQQERDIIMNVICNATQAGDESVAIPAWECLSLCFTSYYHLMASYMQGGVQQLAIQSILSPSENISLQAIEFWSTLSEIERDLQEVNNDPTSAVSEFESYAFVEKSLQPLLSAILRVLPSVDEEDEESSGTEEWNRSMAAASCLSLITENVKDSIFQDNIIMEFVQQNILNSDWRLREASVMAFGSIMDGPNVETMVNYIASGLPFLVSLMDDPSVAVRDTTAWSIGRLIEIYHSIVQPSHIPQTIQALRKGLIDVPRVAVNCCWSLMSIFMEFGVSPDALITDPQNQTSLISEYFPETLTSLFSLATKNILHDENNLRNAAYQSLAFVVSAAPYDCLSPVEKLQNVIIAELNETQARVDQIVSIEDRLKYSELQSNLCIILQNCIKKLGCPPGNVAQQIMTCVLCIFQNAAKGAGSATELEDTLLLIGTLIEQMEEGFTPFVNHLIPYLGYCLSTSRETSLFSAAVGVVGDMARAVGVAMIPFVNDIMQHLVTALQDPSIFRECKPAIISAIGDIAFGIGTQFAPFLQPTLNVLSGAAQVSLTNEDDFDEIDWLIDLRESLLDSYSNILQGVRDDPACLSQFSSSPNLENIFCFLSTLYSDPNRTETMTRNSLGLLGDLITLFGPQLKKSIKGAPWIRDFVHKPFAPGYECSESTKSVQRWAQSILSQHI